MRVCYPWTQVIFKAIYDGSETDEEIVSHPLYPTEVIVECNSYSEADTAKGTFEFNTHPIDPRLIKSLAVLVYMGVKRAPHDEPLLVDENLRFMGFVDIPAMEFSEDGSKVTFEARDYTALLLDTKIGGEMVDLRKPVHEVVQDLLKQEPAFEAIEVVLKGIDTTPNLATFKSDWNHEDAAASEDSYWDKIVDLVQQAGLICYIEKDKLIISAAKNLTPDSYVELFLFGRNVRSIKMQRDLKKRQKTNVEVRSYDDKNKQTCIGKYPLVAQSKKVITGEGSKDKVEVYPFVVKNINDQGQLNQIAESIYWQLVRQEVSGTIETNEAKTLWADKDTVLMSLKHGDAVFAGVHADNNGIVSFHNMSVSEREGYLRSIGYPNDVAGKFAKIYDSDKLNTPYYIKKASHKFDVEEGYSLTVEFINFADGDKLLQEAQS